MLAFFPHRKCLLSCHTFSNTQIKIHGLCKAIGEAPLFLQTIYIVFTYMPLFRLRSKHLKQSMISTQTPHFKKTDFFNTTPHVRHFSTIPPPTMGEPAWHYKFMGSHPSCALISRSFCLKANSSSELAVFMVCCTNTAFTTLSLSMNKACGSPMDIAKTHKAWHIFGTKLWFCVCFQAQNLKTHRLTGHE